MQRYWFTVLLLTISLSIPIALSTQETQNPTVELATIPEESVEFLDDHTDVIESITFPDVKGHWAQSQIENLATSHVVNGYSNGTFGPNDAVTRTQFLIISLRSFGYEVPDKNYADFAYSVGVINDLDLWKNHGDDHVTRAEGLKILLNAADLEVGTALTPNFSDVDTVNDWFAVYSAFAKAQGIVTGDSAGNFNGDSNITRAETCALAVRVLERLPSDRGEPTNNDENELGSSGLDN